MYFLAIFDLDVDTYLYDVGIWRNNREEHVQVNPLKYKAVIQENNFFGYWMTPSGLKP
jgi:hypothetical protein